MHTCTHTLPDSELPKGPASRALVCRKRISGWILNPEKMWISALGYTAARSRRLWPGPPARTAFHSFIRTTCSSPEVWLQHRRPPHCARQPGAGGTATLGWNPRGEDGADLRFAASPASVRSRHLRADTAFPRQGWGIRAEGWGRAVGHGRPCPGFPAALLLGGCRCREHLGPLRQPHSSGRRQLVSQPHGRRP